MRKYLSVFLTIIILDTITKLLANAYLPFEQYVDVFARDVQFYLTYNTGAAGSKAQDVSSQFLNPNLYLFCVGAFGILLGISLIVTRKVHFKGWQKALFIVSTLLALGIIIDQLANSTIWFPSNYTVSWFSKLGGIVAYVGVLVLVKDKWIKIGLLAIIACGTSNLLNHFYPPYNVIDFIYSPLLYEWVHLAICNVADILIDVCLVLLATRVIFLGFKGLQRKNSPIHVATPS